MAGGKTLDDTLGGLCTRWLGRCLNAGTLFHDKRAALGGGFTWALPGLYPGFTGIETRADNGFSG